MSSDSDCPQKKNIYNIMHNDDIQPEPNLWDNEHPEWFIYDAELINSWFWDQFVLEWNEDGQTKD
jgi:hypothetical protein